MAISSDWHVPVDSLDAAITHDDKLRAERSGEWLNIEVDGPAGKMTVTNNIFSSSYRPSLFRRLREAMIGRGEWTFGAEGADEGDLKDLGHFHPVPIRGEPLSATIIADRGER